MSEMLNDIKDAKGFSLIPSDFKIIYYKTNVLIPIRQCII